MNDSKQGLNSTKVLILTRSSVDATPLQQIRLKYRICLGAKSMAPEFIFRNIALYQRKVNQVLMS